MDRTPRLTFKRTVAPTSEPVTLADAKAFARVDIADDDTLITSLIVRAREQCEAITQRQFMPATYVLLMDSFPAYFSWDSYRVTDRREGTDIILPRPPLVAVTSIVYTDQNGAPQTVDPATYVVSAYEEPGRIALAYGQYWPIALTQINTVTITYTAGWADVASVPESIKQAILMLVSHWYESREATAPSASMPKEYDFSVSALLRPYTCTELWQGSAQ